MPSSFRAFSRASVLAWASASTAPSASVPADTRPLKPSSRAFRSIFMVMEASIWVEPAVMPLMVPSRVAGPMPSTVAEASKSAFISQLPVMNCSL